MPRSPELIAEDSPLAVIVGIVTDSAGRVLINQRPTGRPMAGAWEFPGGKLESGESRQSGLARELREELGITVIEAEPLLELSHRYPELHVQLDVWWVTSWSGPVTACDGQALRWVEADALDQIGLLAANGPIVSAVRKRLETA